MLKINIDDALSLMQQGEREFKFIVEPNMIDKARMFLTGNIHKRRGVIWNWSGRNN
jgi:hypothetical protein